ncbi:Uncharacterized protein TCM_001912 [Theobroma cacao]|uniref:Uncharacterized protein n=1 Tax=Theobroma cacao TaxID=3641 RepID=A0A061DK06_THECC|nr:Uncharacterized protein TCM_001912 [Theobroma cacao]
MKELEFLDDELREELQSTLNEIVNMLNQQDGTLEKLIKLTGPGWAPADNSYTSLSPVKTRNISRGGT